MKAAIEILYSALKKLNKAEKKVKFLCAWLVCIFFPFVQQNSLLRESPYYNIEVRLQKPAAEEASDDKGELFSSRMIFILEIWLAVLNGHLSCRARLAQDPHLLLPLPKMCQLLIPFHLRLSIWMPKGMGEWKKCVGKEVWRRKCSNATMYLNLLWWHIVN